MTSNRSYLDNLNLGRQRRPRASVEDLNRALGDLESRFESFRSDDTASDTNRRSRRLAGAQEGPARRAVRDLPAFAQDHRSDQDVSVGSIRRDLERSHQHAAGETGLSGASEDLRALREDLHQQMAAGLRSEFETLRRDIETAYGNSGSDGRELATEMERLSQTLHAIAERSDDHGLEMLRGEMEQVRQTLAELAREETLRTMDSRWSRMEQRSFDSSGNDAALATLGARLEQIGEAVGNLPDTQALLSLEEKVRSLYQTIEQFSRQSNRPSHDTYEIITERLDEISRAIATSPRQADTYDPEPFERIEARISALAHQLDDIASDSGSSELVERLNDLTRRVEDVAHQASLPGKSIERLGLQMASITDRLEAGTGNEEREQILDSLERRFAEIAQLFDERHERAVLQGQSMFKDVERRIGDLATRLESRPDPELGFDPALLQALDEKFAEITRRIDEHRDPGLDARTLEAFERRLHDMAERLDTTFRNASDLDPSLLHALDEKFADLSERIDANRVTEPNPTAMKSLENRLEMIARRLDVSAGQAADVDPQAIASLERQIASLAEQLSQPAAGARGSDDIAPRLEKIEQSLTDQRDAIIAAAHEAAENAVRAMHAGGMNDEDVTALASELKTLEILARKSDERNSRTFEAIHDTLLKVVERLGSIEARNAEARNAEARNAEARNAETRNAESSASRSRILAENVPPIAPRSAEMPMAAPAPAGAGPRPNPVVATPPRRTPGEAAAEAAIAAATNVSEAEEPEPARKSMLGGLARKLTGRKEAPVERNTGRDPVMPGMDDVGLFEPLDASIADKPLEPGSGAPDLNAIIKRVRDERGTSSPQANDPNAAKADFIAAARRAAQAAAAEAQSFKQGTSPDGSKRKFSPSEMLRARRKPILMATAAIMIALASLQLGKAFFGESEEVAAVKVLPSSEGTIVASAPGTVTDEGEAIREDAANVRVVDEPADISSSSSAGIETDVTPLEEFAESDQTDDAGAIIAADGEASLQQDVDVAALPAPIEMSDPAEFDAAPVEAGPIALREAADSGDPKAMFEIGNRYDAGRGVESDRSVAAEWYERAAEEGFAPAQYRIGSFYEKGIGVERDIEQAKTWYQLSANQGNASAMHNLAVLYAMGSDGTVDNDSSARWFQKAAELGVKDSQYNLGILAAKGLGVPQSLEESYKWFALVAKTGDKDAAAKRDEVANALRPEQLAKARAATELWKPKPVDAQANIVEIPESWQESQGTTATIDMKQAIQNIQLILNKNGYKAGAPDGVMGQNTRNAIVAFQQDNGLEATGEVDDKLVKLLLEKK